MLTSNAVCELVRALPEVTEKDHFGTDAFIANKRHFMTVSHAQNSANLRLNLEKQHELLATDGEGFVEIDNAWGRQGWTHVELAFVDPAQFKEAMEFAWEFSKVKAGRLA